MKCLSEETLVEIGENKYLDHNFFISRAMTLPPDITEFDVKACWHLTTSATTTSLGGYIFVIANDELWHDQRMAMPAYNVDLNMTFMQKAMARARRRRSELFFSAITRNQTQMLVLSWASIHSLRSPPGALWYRHQNVFWQARAKHLHQKKYPN